MRDVWLLELFKNNIFIKVSFNFLKTTNCGSLYKFKILIIEIQYLAVFNYALIRQLKALCNKQCWSSMTFLRHILNPSCLNCRRLGVRVILLLSQMAFISVDFPESSLPHCRTHFYIFFFLLCQKLKTSLVLVIFKLITT